MDAFELSAPTRLGTTVVLGYCDISAAGIRVLEGISPASGDERSIMRETGRESLTFSGMGGAVFEGFPALEAVHFDAEDDGADDDDDKSVTLLKLNTAVGEDLVASLSLSIVDLLSAHRLTLHRIIVAAAVQPPKRHQVPLPSARAPYSTSQPPPPPAAGGSVFPTDVVCAFSCGGCSGDEGTSSPLPPLPAAVSGFPALPAAARVADSFLTTLVRLCRLEELPLLVLARQGYRATGAAAEVDGTDEAIIDLGQCLARVVGLGFNSERACGARRSKSWQGVPAAQVVPGYI